MVSAVLTSVSLGLAVQFRCRTCAFPHGAKCRLARELCVSRVYFVQVTWCFLLMLVCFLPPHLSAASSETNENDIRRVYTRLFPFESLPPRPGEQECRTY